MAIKEENEITIRVTCSERELHCILKNQKFNICSEYTTKDIFMIPDRIDILKMETREILKEAVLLREFKGILSNNHKKKITFKKKEIDDNGVILSQYSVNCEVQSIEDAKQLFKHIGYKELMEINEKHYSYVKNNLKIIIKIISNNNILIEAETNDSYKTIEELKIFMNDTKIPFDKSNYFVKKAEEELNKIKNMM